MQIPPYLIEKMLRDQKELHEMLYPESVQVAMVIVNYLQSFGFFTLVFLVGVLLLARKALSLWIK